MKKVLITSGGTKVKIDMVRHIANMSSGTFGSKIAAQSLITGNDVLFFKAKDSKTPFSFNFDLIKQDKEVGIINIKDLTSFYYEYKNRYREEEYEYFMDYDDKLKYLISDYKPDIIVLAAAVSDYGVENYVDGKIRTKGDLSIQLKPYPKVISRIKKLAPQAKLVGFKLLVNSTYDELVEAAKDSVIYNGCDLVVGNDLRDIKADQHRITLVTSKSVIIHDMKDDDPNYLAKKVVEAYNEL